MSENIVVNQAPDMKVVVNDSGDITVVTVVSTGPQGPQGPAGPGVTDATTTAKGVIQLAGDLGGTAAAPTVPGLAAKANTSSLAPVATSGSYTDLTNKPTIPVVTGTNTGDETATTIKTKLGITTLSGANTGDQDLSGYALTSSVTPKADKTYVDSQDAAIQSQVTTNTSNISANTTAISGKEPTITAGTTLQYYRGDKTFQTLNQDVVPDGTTNKAYTAADKARLANTSGTNTGDQDLSGLVPKSATVNAKPLSANVSLTQDDIPSGTTNVAYTAAAQTRLANTSGTNTGDQTTVTGNAGTATKLQTPRNINGVAFDGSGDITVTDSTRVLKTGDTMSGTLTTSGAFVATGDYSPTPSTAGVYIGIPSTLNPRFTMVPASGSVRAVDNASGTIRFVNSTAGTIQMMSDANGLFTFGSNSSPTHTLTLPSVATGIALYNTSDQTTNYERVRHYWNSSVYTIGTQSGGTGAIRAIQITAFGGNSGLFVNSTSASGMVATGGDFGGVGGYAHKVNGSLSSSAGIQYSLGVTPTINQTSTAGYTALLINPTITTTGSGPQLLADFQVGGSSKFSVNSSGAAFASSFVSALSFVVQGASIPANGIYRPATNTLGLSTNSTLQLSIDPNGNQFIATSTAVPAANPVGGGYLYVEAGALKFRGSSGTVTVIAAA